MKKIFKLLFLTSFIFLVLLSKSYAGKGAATVYKVTMKKVELCTGSTGVTSCEGAVVLGDSTLQVDIAAVDAGATAASYGSTALLPLGETYTHLRVTVSRGFTVKGTATATATGRSYTCNTVANPQWPTDEATNKYTHQPAIAKDGTIAEQNTYLMNDSYTQCVSADCSSSGAASVDYSTPNYAAYMETHSADTGTEHILVYALTAPYKVSLIPPVMIMSFGTQNALQARTDTTWGANICTIDALEPIFTVTLR
jgi:hypothetical protein